MQVYKNLQNDNNGLSESLSRFQNPLERLEANALLGTHSGATKPLTTFKCDTRLARL